MSCLPWSHTANRSEALSERSPLNCTMASAGMQPSSMLRSSSHPPSHESQILGLPCCHSVSVLPPQRASWGPEGGILIFDVRIIFSPAPLTISSKFLAITWRDLSRHAPLPFSREQDVLSGWPPRPTRGPPDPSSQVFFGLFSVCVLNERRIARARENYMHPLSVRDFLPIFR